MKRILSLVVAAWFLAGCAGTDIGAYTSGVEVNAQKFDQLVENKSTKKDVENIVGHPPRKEKFGKGEIWYYEFTKIRHIGANVNEMTVFEFNAKGVLTKKYKTGGSGKNPLTGK